MRKFTYRDVTIEPLTKDSDINVVKFIAEAPGGETLIGGGLIPWAFSVGKLEQATHMTTHEIPGDFAKFITTLQGEIRRVSGADFVACMMLAHDLVAKLLANNKGHDEVKN